MRWAGLHIQGPQTNRSKHLQNTRHPGTRPSSAPATAHWKPRILRVRACYSYSSSPISLQGLGSQGLWASINVPSLREILGQFAGRKLEKCFGKFSLGNCSSYCTTFTALLAVIFLAATAPTSPAP